MEAHASGKRNHVNCHAVRGTSPFFGLFLGLLRSAAGWILIVGVAAVVLITWTVAGAIGEQAPKPATTVEPAKFTPSPR